VCGDSVSRTEVAPDLFGAAVEHWHARYESAISPMCDRCRSTFNFALNGDRFALPVDGPCATKESDMRRLIACVIGVALLAGSVGLTIANAQQAPDPLSSREIAQ
jgi:hypothetical protein